MQQVRFPFKTKIIFNSVTGDKQATVICCFKIFPLP